ncbi:predicted protein [Nematostella vectensis]|uniref:Kazal-like domain-containing protein n=1 Tax=Nematostella vectensis TaxID=45351 RepID=A7RHQ6_NEMVE|nr:predicted protein [Nematostella vectensis]|eukprot:XP_001640958.1 predicted protein [Nematostella vectensis]
MELQIKGCLLFLVAFIFVVSICPRGRECIIGEDGNSTSCECSAVCSSEHAPVCSVFYTDHASECEMHKQACDFGFFTAVKHKGKCTKKGSNIIGRQCPVERLLDFHSRYLEWLLVAYKESKHAVMDSRVALEGILDEEIKRIIMWEFDNQDANRNDQLDEHEVKSMIDLREPCMVGFMDACDFDGHPGITRHEWNACFPTRLEGQKEGMVV